MLGCMGVRMAEDTNGKEPEFTSVDDLAASLCREMGYGGRANARDSVEFAWQCTTLQNDIFKACEQGLAKLYRDDRPYPFVFGGLDAQHGGLRLKAQGVATLRCRFLDSPEPAPLVVTAVIPAPEPQAVPVVAGASDGTALVWTPERKAQARAMQNKLRGDGIKAFATQTAKAFDVTPARLRKVLNPKGSKAGKHWQI